MAKDKTAYVCSNCGYDSPKWLGKCPSCGQWNTFQEVVIHKESPAKSASASIGHDVLRSQQPMRLRDIDAAAEPRIDMHDEELNRVLGGGLVKGSLVLLGGKPGIGKSTLVMQTVLQMSEKRILYVSGEESQRQLKLRADRLQHSSVNDEDLFDSL